ncbi:MAG: hypothetical protein AAFX56_17735 [Pseudomonadota bacterium]
METLEERLKRDAAAVRAEISPELEERIRASLENAHSAEPASPARARPGWFWLMSSLTGAAAALVIIAVLNGQEPERPPSVADVEPLLRMPALDVRPAMLGPLEEELDNLKKDFEKAERVVREDVDSLLGETER